MADTIDNIDAALIKFDANVQALNAVITACRQEQAEGRTGVALYQRAVQLRDSLAADADVLRRRIDGILGDL